MKKSIALVLIVGAITNGFSQLSFQTPNSYPVDDDPDAMASGDFNEDGFIDLVTANNDSNSDNLSILINDEFAGFTDRTDVGLIGGPGQVKVADVNGDGHDDILTTISISDEIAVLLGDGLGNFASPVYFPTGDAPFDLVLGDVNGDTFTDIVNTNRGDDNISILLGDGTGSFSAPTTVMVGSDPAGVELGLFNADAFLDIAVVNNDDLNVQILLGNGAGNFSGSTLINFASSYSHIALADLNSDGNVDITGDGTTSFFTALGDGLGGFGTPEIYPGFYEASRGTTGDVDGDGNIDAIFWARDFALYILKGDGSGILTTHIKLYIDLQPGTGIIIDDADNDGDLDILLGGSPSPIIHQVQVLLNDGNGNFNTPVQYPLLPFTPNFEGAHSIVSGDFNEDGAPDIASTNHEDDQLALMFGNGNGQFTLPEVTTTGNDPRDLVKGDFNEDNHLDLITINWIGNNMTLFEGDGAGNFTLLSTTPVDVNGQYFDVGDFNEDDHLDMVVSGGSSNNFTYYLGDGSGNFAAGVPTSLTSNNFDIRVADVNNDTHDDVMVSFNSLGEVGIWLGDGLGNFSDAGNYNTGNAFWLDYTDLNLDGNVDILVSNGSDILLGVGDGTFSITTITGAFGFSDFKAADIDQDGQLDLISGNQDIGGAFGVGRIRVFKLDAALNVVDQWEIENGSIGGFKLVIDDFNMDGLPDIASTDVNYNGIWVLTNNSTSICTSVNISSTSNTPSQQCEGDEAIYEVFATGDAPITYQWSKDGSPITGANASSITISNLSTNDSGTYGVLVSNACGTDQTGFVLTVNPTTSFTLQPTDQTVNIGESATFIIMVDGDNLTYQWQKDAIDIANETNPNLTLNNVTVSDQGDYTCVVTGSCNTVISSAATLIVIDTNISFSIIDLGQDQPIDNGQQSPINFGQTNLEQSISRSFSIENTGTQTLNINSITSSDQAFEIIDIPEQVPAAGSQLFEIIFSAITPRVYTSMISALTDAGAFLFPISAEVTDSPSTESLIVYNAVAPNGNGKHDFFKIENIESFANNSIEIFNRWGIKVYEASGYDNQNVRFEGNSNIGGDKRLVEGTYFYVIQTETDQLTGFLHLRR